MPNVNLLSKKQKIYLSFKVYWPEILIILFIFVMFSIFFNFNSNPIKINSEIQISHHTTRPIIKKIFNKPKKKLSKPLELPVEIFIPINYSSPDLINEFFNLHGKHLLSKNGHYFFDSRQHQLWIQDNDDNVKHILKLISQLDKPTKQILIETRIVNIVKEATVDFGLRMKNKSNPRRTFGMNNPLGQFNMDFGDVVSSASAINMTFTKLMDSNILDLQLAALEASNKAKIIASPKITTINHEAAIIESGEDIPYQESSNNGGTTTNFKKAVLSLQVVPHILPNKELLLNLKIQQDIPSNKTINGVPSVITKAMKTHVLLTNGETVILGGIYQINLEDNDEHVPLWGDTPIIKHFFNKKHQQKRREQLVIFITPHIM